MPSGSFLPPNATMSQWGLVTSPWSDRGGQFSALKASVFLGLLSPAAFTAWQWGTGGLGARPVTAAIDATGLWSIRCLLLAFSVTPIRSLADWSGVASLRRMLGVAAMCYGLAHFGLYAVDQGFQFGVVAHEIVHRLYLTVGFVALIVAALLGGTSTDGWIRKLGRSWKRLHKAVYAVILFASSHFFMWSKVVSFEAVFVAGLFLWLIAWRALPRKMQGNLPALVALGPTIALATAR